MNYTFGKSVAAQVLEELLKNDLWSRKKITRLLCEFNEGLLKIIGAKDPKMVRVCMELYKEHMLKRLGNKIDLSDDIRSHTRNVIIARHRIYRECFDEVCRHIAKNEKKI